MKIEKEHQKYPFILKQSYGGKGVNSQFSNNNYIKPIVNRFDEILSSNFLSRLKKCVKNSQLIWRLLKDQEISKAFFWKLRCPKSKWNLSNLVFI